MSSTAKPAKAKSSGMSPALRITISILVALVIGLFALLWHGAYIPNPANIPPWVASNLIVPALAVVLSFGANCLVQQLSCGQIQLGVQASRLMYIPLPFWVLSLLLFFFPGLLWPIEGLVQHMSPIERRGLSMGFYTFWIALYTQAFLNGLAQVCPK